MQHKLYDESYNKKGDVHRWLRRLMISLSFLLLLWLIGLSTFYFVVMPKPSGSLSKHYGKVDAIVVFTGNSSRIRKALELLYANYAKKMFISGVYPGNAIYTILRLYKVKNRSLENKIKLGYKAENTNGNVQETEDWLKSNNFHSILLVTSDYHMPRVLFLFRKKSKIDIKIVPVVVKDRISEVRIFHRTYLVVSEYVKYVAGFIGYFFRVWI